MTRIAVLGGTGYLGRRTVAALASIPGVSVSAASRSAEVRVDVTRPETWEALAPFDLVIDLSDTVRHPPDALIAWCLARDKTVLEATSDAPCVERLHRAHARSADGRLVLGAGIFTGMSNLLARDVAREVGETSSVTLGVATSPFSGAGRGTIALMVSALDTPAVRYIDGARVETREVTPGPTLDFDGALRPTVRGSLAEAYMLRESTGAPTVDALLAPKPSLLARVFTSTPAFIARQRWYLSLLGGYFTLLRRFVLRGVPTAVELYAEARGAEGTASRVLKSRDGMGAAAFAIAAIAERLPDDPSWRGARFVDDVCALAPTVARANELARAAVFELAARPAPPGGRGPRTP